jgi:hypothetical protein
VTVSLDAAGEHYGELLLALDWPPDRFDDYYAEALTSLARHAANLFANVRMMNRVPISSAA